MNKRRNRTSSGKQAMSANLRKIARQNQLYGFRMAPDEFADYITAKSEQVEKELRERWS